MLHNRTYNNTNITQYAGPILQARITVVDFLKEAGLYRGVHDNPMRLGISSRSKDVIEPLLKPQWWVACSDMAARSCAAVRSGELEVIPKVRPGAAAAAAA
jgi:valyl-tRNA synthetase